MALSTQVLGAGLTEETCADRAGKIFVSNNGTRYCMSPMAMNWWTAIGWCQSIGMELIDAVKDCQYIGETCPSFEPCPNFAIEDMYHSVWSASVANTSTAWIVIIHPDFSPQQRSKTQQMRSFCKLK